jgi:hypothetical protein
MPLELQDFLWKNVIEAVEAVRARVRRNPKRELGR